MMNRRRFLQLMVAGPMIVSAPLQIPLAQASDNTPAATLLRASEMLTGRQGLDASVADRLCQLLSKQNSRFPGQLARLMAHLQSAGETDRQRLVDSLDDDDINTALTIISPWYLGYTGHPSTTKATDDAEFVTFLSALMYEPTRDVTLRPSYARAGSDYWAEVPQGVNAPPMPVGIRQWGENTPAAAKTIPAPEAPWLLMVQGKARTLAEANALLAAEKK
jgi:hypothetical protein